MKKFHIIISIAVAIMLAPLTTAAQTKITKPGAKPTTTTVKPRKSKVTKQATPSRGSSLSTTPSHLDLMVKRNGKNYFVNVDEWSRVKDKSSYSIIGIVFFDSRVDHPFVLGWEDADEYAYKYDWFKLCKTYGSLLPTKTQADIIAGDTALRDIARAYGNDNYGNYYWTRTSCPAPDSDCAFIFCPGIPDAAFNMCPKTSCEATGDGTMRVVLVYPLPQ